jgi:hypothetical protein
VLRFQTSYWLPRECASDAAQTGCKEKRFVTTIPLPYLNRGLAPFSRGGNRSLRFVH